MNYKKVVLNKLNLLGFLKFIYIVLFILLYNYNYITNDRLYLFLFILLLILIFTRLIRLLKSDKQYNFINKNNLDKLFAISKYKNILLYLISYIELKLYDLFRYLNSILNSWIVVILYFILMHIFIKPIKLLFYFYYKVIIRWSSVTVLELLFKRIEGLIFSVLIFSNLYTFILNLIWGYEFILLYLILIISNLIIEYNHGNIKIWKIKFNINIDYNNLLRLRYQVSIINILILKYLEKNHLKVNKNYKNLINYWYIEKNFESLIDFYKLEIINYWKLIKLENKNKPSLLLYNWLHKLYNSNLLFSNLLENKYYLEKNLDTKVRALIKFMYEWDKLKVKFIIFLLWDIEEYYGITDIKHYKSDLGMDLADLYITNVFNDLSYVKKLQIKKNSNDYTFYDLNSNFQFFYKLHIFLNDNKLYQKYIGIIENDLNIPYDRTIDCYNNVGILYEDELLGWISDYINNSRREWSTLNLYNKIVLYQKYLKLLYEYNEQSINLFNESWIDVYIDHYKKNKKTVMGVDKEFIDWLDNIDVEDSLIESKKSRIRRFLEYILHSL